MWGNEGWHQTAARAIGVLIGVLASLIMIAPEGTKNNAYRVLISITMGFIFAPLVPDVPFMAWTDGDSIDHAMARGAACGFAIWSVLQAIARLLSARGGFVERTLREMARLRGGRDS